MAEDYRKAIAEYIWIGFSTVSSGSAGINVLATSQPIQSGAGVWVHSRETDTVKLVQITDRTRASRSQGYRDREEKIVVKTDTVYVAIDSVTVNNRPATVSSKRSTVNQTLKWLFAILCAVIGLTLTIRFCLRKAL